MTTIAWDGRILAGDTQATAGGGMIRRVRTKIHRIEGFGLMGFTGRDEDMHRLLHWLRVGMPEETRPKFEADSMSALVIKPEGCFRIESGCIVLEVLEPFHAIGNGRDYALAAMHCGKNAIEAVEIACLYDIYSSPPITSLMLDQS